MLPVAGSEYYWHHIYIENVNNQQDLKREAYALSEDEYMAALALLSDSSESTTQE